MSNSFWFQLLKCNNFLLFLAIVFEIEESLDFRLLVEKNKHLKGITWAM